MAFLKSLICRKEVYSCPVLSRAARFTRGKPPGVAKSLAEKLADHNQLDPELIRPIDIGLPPPRSILTEEKQKIHLQKLKDDKNLELATRHRKLKIPLDEVYSTWQKTIGPRQIKEVAEHYGIYQDMFDGAHFSPWLPLSIKFDGGDFLTPVFYGNHIKPSESTKAPEVFYEADPNTLWTLILTNLDCHYEDSTSEYLHWFLGNIPANQIDKAQIVCDYMQPFPARGTGYHRYVFILYKQTREINYSELMRKTPCLSLKERTFKTYDFYKAHQDSLTPATLAFFQSDWDESLTEFFHNTLEMKEPIFAYDHLPPYVKPQVWTPHKQAFDAYLDKYRDPKEIAEEVLQLRLKKLDPFEKEPPPPMFPLVHRPSFETASWLKKQLRLQAIKRGKYKDL